MSKSYLTILSVFALGCAPSEPPPKFTYADKIRLAEYQAKFEDLRQKRQHYLEELERMESVANMYRPSVVFKLTPVHFRTDGEKAVCYSGKIVNSGGAEISHLSISIDMYQPDGEILTQFTNIVGPPSSYAQYRKQSMTGGEVFRGKTYPCYETGDRNISLEDVRFSVSNLILKPHTEKVTTREVLNAASKAIKLKEKKQASDAYYKQG